MLPSAMIAVRGKSVGKQDRRDAQRAQDQLRKNNNAALGNIKKSGLFYVPGFQTKILALGASGLEPLACQSVNLGGHCPLRVTDIVRARSDVRFAFQSGRSAARTGRLR